MIGTIPAHYIPLTVQKKNKSSISTLFYVIEIISLVISLGFLYLFMINIELTFTNVMESYTNMFAYMFGSDVENNNIFAFFDTFIGALNFVLIGALISYLIHAVVKKLAYFLLIEYAYDVYSYDERINEYDHLYSNKITTKDRFEVIAIFVLFLLITMFLFWSM